ncbi:uncharacterized protein K444DRAFT_32843 [Hyaloscypha bicolor E]|uniref:Uncharacterized protein n=1 Tax=Hyaloscypha bicolor E TaxID=1095630 RepID=A0A2J6T3X3_9HELO|nr:uncharacterized protein K444DRAFT_32843 [Hyaloscypha bicolor E]PMD57707.1 hypothetical protein K444DRAFT_32843 [Hyaloscypha bicolor E]
MLRCRCCRSKPEIFRYHLRQGPLMRSPYGRPQAPPSNPTISPTQSLLHTRPSPSQKLSRQLMPMLSSIVPSNDSLDFFFLHRTSP